MKIIAMDLQLLKNYTSIIENKDATFTQLSSDSFGSN